MIGIVALNLGGPDSPGDVRPFLRNLFADPDTIQLGWARPLQPLIARVIAWRRAAFSRAAYDQIGGRSPIRSQSTAQAKCVALALASRGISARAYVAMSCWHPLAHETVAAMRRDGITHAVAVPLFPHYSSATTGGALKGLARALAGSDIKLARVERYPDAPGYLSALGDCLREAMESVPQEYLATAPVLFSAHGLPGAYIERGDPYLDDIRITVAAVTRTLKLGARARLCFQSRVGRQRWLGPTTGDMIDSLAREGHRAIVVCPVSFTGEHIETLQEIDILYRTQARARGIEHFARARTVGCHPAFIEALADLAARALAERPVAMARKAPA